MGDEALVDVPLGLAGLEVLGLQASKNQEVNTSQRRKNQNQRIISIVPSSLLSIEL